MSWTARRWLLAAGGLVVALSSLRLCGDLAQASTWVDLGTELRESVRPRPGPWRLLRGTLHYVAIPALIVVSAAAGYAVWRRDRRAAVLFGLVLLASNLVVQGVKHGPLPAADQLNPLSGHAGLAAGLACAWTLTASIDGTRWRPASMAGAVLVAAGTASAVLLTGWHTLPQVLAPIGIAGGCALVGRAMGPVGLTSATSRRVSSVLLLSGAVAGCASWWGAGSIDVPASAGVGPAVLVVLAAVVAATCGAAGLIGVTAGS